jgi:hypothetical protein
LIFSQVLYQLSYLGNRSIILTQLPEFVKRPFGCLPLCSNRASVQLVITGFIV